MQTASRISEEERRPPRIGPETRVSRTLTLRQWAALQAAARQVAVEMQRGSLNMRGRRNQIHREQFAECAAELVRAVHELERQ